MSSPPTSPPVRRPRKWLFRLVALGLVLLFALSILEIGLRLIPAAQMRIRGGRIALPLNQKTEFRNTTISKVDPIVTQTRNSLGFRGEDPPSDLKQRLSIVTVGGSTTECYYLSDDRTWSEQLRKRLSDFPKLWLNNAGLDGHTTFGHAMLFDQYLAELRPRCLLFLIGANDVGREQSADVDERLRRDQGTRNPLSRCYFWIVEHSAVAALCDNVRRTTQARAAGVHHQDINHAQLQWNAAQGPEHTDSEAAAVLEEHRTRFLPGYCQRVESLLKRCRDHQIVPVLITQPALFGPGIDPETGVDLARVAVGKYNGSLQWQILEIYNDVTREVAKAEGVTLIDLAREMGRSSRFYYDYYHFTNDGAEEVARIISIPLKETLQREFPEFTPGTTP